ncbi:MAG: hypothetical protein KIS66_02660 [Fimbriimonadaceae bacterium]|nr:hypothetical protein [Fimbriimonadaceae bacterium]
MGCVVSLVGGQDPLNRHEADGPILSALAEERAFDGCDLLLVSVDNPGATDFKERAVAVGKTLVARGWHTDRIWVAPLEGRPDRREDAFGLMLGGLMPVLREASAPLHFLTSSGTPALREAMHECWRTLRDRMDCRVWRRPEGGPVQEDDIGHLETHADVQAGIEMIRRSQWGVASQILRGLRKRTGQTVGASLVPVVQVLDALGALESGRWNEVVALPAIPDFGQSRWGSIAEGARGTFPAAYGCRLGVQLAFAIHFWQGGRNPAPLLRQALENAARFRTTAVRKRAPFNELLDGIPGFDQPSKNRLFATKSTLDSWLHDEPEGGRPLEVLWVVETIARFARLGDVWGHPLMPRNLADLSVNLQHAVLSALYPPR